MQARVQANVPRTLTWCMRSNRFIGVSRVPVRLIALALLTRMSIPPKRSAVRATASSIWRSSRTSTAQASAWPPAASISAAAVWIVPGSLGWTSVVFAAMATLAPSRAARSAIASPMPRLAPVMKSVLPARSAIYSEYAPFPIRPFSDPLSPVRGGEG